MLRVTHFTDPGCPWAYSASPDLAVLRWRYGAQLDWRHVMIGLAEDPQVYVDRGYTPEEMAATYARFRRFGMPFATEPKPRVSATSPACRALIAVRQSAPEREWAAFRALQFAQFTSVSLLDDVATLRAALSKVDGVDEHAVVDALESPVVWEAYEADRAETRSAEGGATHFQGKSANSDGAERYTAPSLLLEAQDGRRLEAGGFQSIEAYDLCVANLDRTLERRPPAAEPLAVLREFSFALATREVPAVLAPPLTPPDATAAEAALDALAAEGAVRREAVGDGALWQVA